MKHSKVVIALLLISNAGAVLASASSTAKQFTATPYFSARSQSANLALEMVGQEGYINRSNAGDNYSVISLAVGYQQSFRGSDIARCLFGNDIVCSNKCAQLNISGSSVTGGRGANDWFADYFGLATDFKSSIQFNPRVSNAIVDANFYMGLDNWKEGMYFRMHIPFVSTSWTLDLCETVTAKGVANHPFGYFSGTAAGNLRAELLNSASDFFVNGKTPSLINNLTFAALDGTAPTNAQCDTAITGLTTIVYNDGIVFEPLNNSKWACDSLKKSGVADWRFTLGYNAYSSEKYNVGFGVTGAAPTGNRPHGEFLFEPILGNGNHWELGAQFTSHYRFWQSENEERSLTGYLDANITHLFNTRQTRSFDLVGKPNSRYMLAEKLGAPCFLYNATLQKCITTTPVGCISNEQRGTVTSGLCPAVAEFKNVYTPVANLTTVDVKVGIGAQIDLALMLNFTARNWSVDLGYNLWARTCERIKLDCDCPNRLTDGNTWALKGDAKVYGANAGCSTINLCTTDCPDDITFLYQTSIGTGSPYALGATQSKSTIYGGTNSTSNVTPTTAPTNAYFNPGIDSPRFAVVNVNIELCPDITQPTLATEQRSGIKTAVSPLNGLTANASGDSRIMNSKAPVFLTVNDLDLEGAQTKGLSHKIFANVSYQWLNKDSYVPFVGAGVSAEFVNGNGSCCDTKCSTSSSSSTSSTTSCATSCKTDCNSSCDLGCKRCGLSQWFVWVKGGMSFN